MLAVLHDFTVKMWGRYQPLYLHLESMMECAVSLLGLSCSNVIKYICVCVRDGWMCVWPHNLWFSCHADCCDGSDEWLGISVCPNVCAEEGKHLLARVDKQIEEMKRVKIFIIFV